MSSNRAKGNACERRAELYLRDKGYLVHRAYMSGRSLGGKWISRSNDIFGLFDLVAVAPDAMPLFVQVTSNDAASPRRRAIFAESRYLNPALADFELWIWHSGKRTERTKVRQEWTAERLVNVCSLACPPGCDTTSEGHRGARTWTKIGYLDMEESANGNEEEIDEAELPFGAQGEGEEEEQAEGSEAAGRGDGRGPRRDGPTAAGHPGADQGD